MLNRARLCVPVLVLSLVLLAAGAASLSAGGLMVTVRSADSGKYAARCNGCVPGGAYPDNVAVHETNPDKPWAQWMLEKNAEGYYTLRSKDSGKYWARCNGCIPGGAYPESAFCHETDPSKPWAQWTLERNSAGRYTLRSKDSGKYSARCNSCILGGAYPDNVFVHETDPSKPWAQWEISIVP